MRLIELPANIAITGSTMSGKSYLAAKLIREQLWCQIDALVICSPTIHLSGDFHEFQENEHPKRGKIVRKFSNDFVRVITDVVEQNEAFHAFHRKKDIPNVLVVLDDMVGNSILRFKGLIDRLSTKARHLKVSFVVLAQRISAVPRTFRLNCKYFIAFNTTNFSELERLAEELIPKSLRKGLLAHIAEVYDEPYNFLLIECFSPRISQRVWKNGVENLYTLLSQKATTSAPPDRARRDTDATPVSS